MVIEGQPKTTRETIIYSPMFDLYLNKILIKRTTVTEEQQVDESWLEIAHVDDIFEFTDSMLMNPATGKVNEIDPNTGQVIAGSMPMVSYLFGSNAEAYQSIKIQVETLMTTNGYSG